MELVREQPTGLATAANFDAPAAEVGQLPLLAMVGVVEDEESTDPKDWENLLPELVCEVATNLLRSDVTEYIRLRAVCNPWRSATADSDPKLLEPRFFPRNWQMLRRNTWGEKARFVNVLTGASLKVQIPPEYGSVVANADGCLVLENKTTLRMRLLNPMTMAVADLPYLFVYFHPDDQFVNVNVTAAGIVSDGGEALTVVVCMTVGNMACIRCANPGDTAWRLVDAGIERGEVPMFEGGLTVCGSFYIPKRTGDVLKVVLRPRPRLEHVARLQDGRHRVGGFGNVRFYLVPSLDDTDDGMLLVRGLYDHNHGEMDVFQVNIRNRSITELHNMGARTIFLPSLTLRSDKFPALHEMMGMLSHDDVEMHI
ncbi:unnamed protein product [Alopecurus aequalis]